MMSARSLVLLFTFAIATSALNSETQLRGSMPTRELLRVALSCTQTIVYKVESIEASGDCDDSRNNSIDCQYLAVAKPYLEDNCVHAYKYDRQHFVSSGDAHGGAYITDYEACLDFGVLSGSPPNTKSLGSGVQLANKDQVEFTTCADLGYTRRRGTTTILGESTVFYSEP